MLKGQLSYFQKFYDIIGVSGQGPHLVELQERENIRVIPIKMYRQITPLKDLRSLFQLYRVFKREKPFIVHSITPKAGLLSMLAARLARVPIRMHTVSGLPLMEIRGSKRKLLEVIEKITYACANKVYPNSTGLYDFIVRNNFTTPKKLFVIGNGSSNGINTSLFSIEHFTKEELIDLKQRLQIENHHFVFIFIGRLVGDKGLNELIEAFVQLNDSNTKLLLVGPFETNLDPLQKRTIQQIESNRNIIAVGAQKDVRPYFAISHCLVFPSYREGFPNVVMQAGAMGLPGIVSDINGCNEIIVNEQNGLIIPKKDVEALVKSMRKIMDDTNLYKCLQQNARPMIVSRYEQQIVWDAILHEYQMLSKSFLDKKSKSNYVDN